MFALNGTYLRAKIIIHFNILLYITILYLTSIPVNFNEYPLQTFSLRNKKMALWVSIAFDLVLNIFVLQRCISK